MSRAGVLPPGIEAGGVGKRFVSYLIDGLIPAILSGVIAAVIYGAQITDQVVILVLSIAFGLVVLGWAVLCWWMLATKGSTPGMKLMKLQFVSLQNGRPVGWGRAFLRQLVLGVLAGTTVGAIVLLVTILTNVRGQGLHDLAGAGVVIKQRDRSRQSAPASGTQPAPVSQAPSGAAPVGLPAHLQSNAGFAPSGQAWPGSGYAPPASASSAAEVGNPGQPNPAQANPGQSTPAQPFGGAGQQYGGAEPHGARGPQAGAPGQQYGGVGQYGAPAGAANAGPSGPGWGAGAPGNPSQPNNGGQPWSGPGQTAPASQSSAPQPPMSQPSAPSQPAPFQGPGGPPQGQPPGGAPNQPPANPWGEPTAPITGIPTFGAPSEEPGQTPAAAGPPNIEAQVADEQPDDGTRLVPRVGSRAPDQGWLIALDGGRTVKVEGLVLIGRNPQPRAGEENAELVAVGESARTVSKTHLAVGVDQRGVWVSDRGSTNGSAIANPSGEYEPCQPGEIVRVREGQIITFGEHRLEIQRSYA